jgi:hypothetical protein
MIGANFDLKFPLQIDSQEDNLEAKIENLQRQLQEKNEYINIVTFRPKSVYSWRRNLRKMCEKCV